MAKKLIVTAAFTGALAVVLGAFGAHKLKSVFEPDILAVFETGVKYQMYHSLALLGVGILLELYKAKRLLIAGRMFIAGMILFSGSLYALCFIKHFQLSATWVGAITPLGGVCFIAGWLIMAVAISAAKREG